MIYNYDIDELFTTIIKTIDLIFNNEFYSNDQSLMKVKKIIENWYFDFKENKTLKNISVEDLKYVDLEITNFFDKYIEIEPIKHNYTEILSYNFDIFQKEWKYEMEKISMNNKIDNLKKNMSKIMDLSLAFENYCDNTGSNLDFLNEIYKKASDLRNKKDLLGEEEQIKISNEIINDFEKLLDTVGRDKFIFYDDGSIEYKWDYSLLKEAK